MRCYLRIELSARKYRINLKFRPRRPISGTDPATWGRRVTPRQLAGGGRLRRKAVYVGRESLPRPVGGPLSRLPNWLSRRWRGRHRGSASGTGVLAKPRPRRAQGRRADRRAGPRSGRCRVAVLAASRAAGGPTCRVRGPFWPATRQARTPRWTSVHGWSDGWVGTAVAWTGFNYSMWNVCRSYSCHAAAK